jgi:hypothetical protein
MTHLCHRFRIGGRRCLERAHVLERGGDDGNPLIVQAGDSMYQSTGSASGWSRRRALGPELNMNGSEVGALFSPSGQSMLFARDTKTDLSGEFFVWHRGAREAWPPSCPAAAR